MDKKSKSPIYAEVGMCYEIKIKGQLASHWSDWVGGMQISEDEHGNTNLRGFVEDQSALHGILTQIRNLGLVLISVMPLVNEEQGIIEIKSKNNENNE